MANIEVTFLKEIADGAARADSGDGIPGIQSHARLGERQWSGQWQSASASRMDVHR